MVRVTAEVFVSALTRQVFNTGGFAAIENRGAQEAGAIYISWRQPSGTYKLYGPAPQMLYGADDSRLFELLLAGESEHVVTDKLASEKRYDPDIWIVEIECPDLPKQINVATAE